MTDKDLDKTLAEFLSQQSEDKRQGYTIAGIYIQMHEFIRQQKVMGKDIRNLKEADEAHDIHFEEQDAKIEEHENRLDAHRTAIISVKRILRQQPQVNGSEEFHNEMDTGTFDIAAIQRKLNEQEKKRMESERVKAENATWFKRHLITISSTALGTIIVAAISILYQLLVRK